MGYTNETFNRIIPLLDQNPIHSVLDLGAQNDYRGPNLPAPYTREWYKERGLTYTAIDISGEDGAFPFDLAYPLEDDIGKFDLIVDAGTSEHIGINGAHNPEAFFNCLRTKHELLNLHGFMVSENPKSGHWPGHGFNYYTTEFYERLAKIMGYKVLDLGEHPAMGNSIDGMNVHCVLQKMNESPFMGLEKFIECGIQTN